MYSSTDSSTDVLSNYYTILDKIGHGSFGEVHIAEKTGGGYVAVKTEERSKPPRVVLEYKIYRYLHKKGFNDGIPKVYDFFQTPLYNIIVMELLGPNLDDLLEKYDMKFDISTVLLLVDKIIVLLQKLHTLGYLHRDIKPNNFLIGRGDSKKELYMMDFGLSKKYVSKEGVHNEYRDGRSLIGTTRYASVNMHRGVEPSRRDDLESVGHMIVYFLKGVLPWQNLKKRDGMTQIQVVGEVKMSTPLETVCEDIPCCFKKYLSYCRNLKYDETPDYRYLRSLFQDYCVEKSINPKFIWMI